MIGTLIERFEAMFAKGDDDECWEWTGAIKSNGYGVIGKGGRKDGVDHAHRVAYRIYNGQIPVGFDVCHTCDNRKCVNPRHLYVGTRKDNMQDCVRRGRTNKPAGEKCQNAKLTVSYVIAIRSSSETNKSLAKKYGVSVSAVRYARKSITWKHVLKGGQNV